MTKREATDVQKRKYEKFINHEFKDESVEFLNQIIEYSELKFSDIGITWGVTVMPDAKTLIRVNIGTYEFVNVSQSKSGEECRVLICVKGKPRLPVLIPKSLSVGKSGFKLLVDDFAMYMTLGKDSSKMLGMKNIQAAILQGAKSRMLRDFPNTNCHNPMTEKLITK